MDDNVPAAVVWAARHWGGEGVAITRRDRTTRGIRDTDGGAQRIPPGWTFRADGFTYHVFRRNGRWHWTDGSPWGSSCSFWRDGDHWVVDGMAGLSRHPA